MSTLATAGPSPLWYLTRGTGLVAVTLLTATVALGVTTNSRWQRPGWPRFASLGLHRNLSLLAVLFLGVHIITAELDTFAPVGWLAVMIPFGSAYRPVWLGLGTVAFDLLVAVIVTSLLRARFGHRTWRAVHWLSYLSWPVAMVHGLGTGSDSSLRWVQLLYVVCLGVVLYAVAWRLAHSARSQVKAAGTVGVAAATVLLLAWTLTGPVQPGWAKRAGTPVRLLSSGQGSSTAGGAGAASNGSPAVTSPAPGGGLPALPFGARINGSLVQAGPDQSGQVTITVSTRVTGSMTGGLVVVLRGQATDGGVSLASSTVTFGSSTSPGSYRGRVVMLNGDQLVARVSNSAGSRVDLGVLLQIDPSSGSVTGSIRATQANSSGPSSGGDGDGGN